MSGDAPSATVQSLLSTVWRRHRATILEQVAVVERAADGLRDGVADPALCEAAARESHKLAGSLGTLGFAAATPWARELEQLLGSPDALGAGRASRVAALARQLRDALGASPSDAVVVASEPRSTRDPPTILVIDDDPVVVAQIVAEGARRGLLVLTAASPAQGRARAADEQPDLVLLDLTFADGTASAYELLTELTAAAAVPVLVMTVRDGFVDRVEVARRGARGFVPKSLPVRRVLDQATQLIERTRTEVITLLAVDDDRVVLDAIAALLKPQGIDVVGLDDPLRVWEQLERSRPDIVMLDIDMPGVSGIDICHVLRNDPRWATIPILFLTGHNDTEAIERVFTAGADDYLMKPVVPAELIARIRNRLDRFTLHRLLAETDALTGISNRQSLTQKLERLIQLADRFGEPLALAQIDLDAFKAVNDRYGHALGDVVLRRMGDLLRQTFRGEDVVGRWGGEEFVVGMYGMTRRDAEQRLLALLDAFSEETFTTDDRRSFAVSFSAGVAQRGADGADLDSLYRAADAALYRAKDAGRARVETAAGVAPA